MTLIPFATQSRPGDHVGERLINYFFQPGGNGGFLMGRSGLSSAADTGSGAEVYAVEEMGGELYAITASNVYKVSGSTVTDVGTIHGNSDIRTAASADQLAIVTNGTYYICDGTTTTGYATGSITDPVDVCFLRGYFVLIGTNSGRTDTYQISALDDGTTFDGLDFATAESNPDGAVAILAYRNEVVIVGKNTIEPHYLSGGADFPFAANTGAVMERGCLNGKTVAADDNGFFWLGNDGVVYRNGAFPTAVSSLEAAADIATRTADRAFTFMDRGHKFYALRMTTGTTWVLNIVTGAWQEFSSEASHNPWIALSAKMVDGVQYFGTTTGKVCTQSGYNDDGKVLRAEMVTPPVTQGGEYFSIGKVHINFVTGKEDVTATPQVALEVTRDTKNWTDEKWRPLADLGGYMKRATWHGLGAGRWMQARIWITDEVKRDMIGGSYG